MPGTRTIRDSRELPGATVVPAGGVDSWSRALILLLSSLVIGLSACNLFTGRDSALHYDLPLTVQIRPDPSITAAVLDYRDACGQPSQVKIDGILQETLKRKLRMVFQHAVVDASAVPGAVDGVVDVGLGLKQLELFVPRRPPGPIRQRSRWDWIFPIAISTEPSAIARNCRARVVTTSGPPKSPAK